MRSFVQNSSLVIVNGDIQLELSKFLLLEPNYKLNKDYSSIQYIAKDSLLFIEGNVPIDKVELLDDDVMWPDGEKYILLVQGLHKKEQEALEAKAQAVITTNIDPDLNYEPQYPDLVNFMAMTKKERKEAIVSMPRLLDKDIMKNLIKRARNTLLIRSDWAAMPDYPFTEEERAPWVAYRKALRDYMQITKDKDILDLPQFPKAPQ